MNNFAHHYEFDKSGLELSDQKMIDENRAIYDYQVDMKKNKWAEKKIKKNRNFKTARLYFGK